jgi:hypothetical protein
MKKHYLLFLAFLLFLTTFFSSQENLICPNGMTGSGIEGDECQITSWADLAAIESGLSLHYKLMNDLDSSSAGYAGLGDDWTPLGDGVGFDGEFNGGNYTISDLIVDAPETEFFGLFSIIIYGEISDLGLVDVDITGNSYVGALAGNVIEEVITNCYSNGSVNGGVYVLTCIGSSERDIKNLYLRYTTPWGEVAMEPLFSGKVFGGYIREEEDGRGLVARYGIEENGKKMYREVEISYGSGVANSEKAYSIEQKEYEDEMPSNVRNYFSGR